MAVYTVKGGNVKWEGVFHKVGDVLNIPDGTPGIGKLIKQGFLELGEVEVIPEPKQPFIVPPEEPEMEVPILCSECDKVFKTEAALEKHMAKKHTKVIAEEGQAPSE